MDCIFCKIIAGEIPSAKIYEDGDVLAFLDINPDAKGHTLVIPKKHAVNIFDIDEESLKQVFVAGQKVAKHLKEKLQADGINFIQSNGAAANQIVMHSHLHVIPRFEGDGTKLLVHGLDQKNNSSPDELEKLAKLLSF
jgi:histidine triad (HIT) family protein